LNYITHRPRTDKKFAFSTRHTLGSDNQYSTYNAVDGMIDRVGYHAYLHHRQTQGLRDANSDLGLYSGSAMLILDAHSHTRWILSIDGYSEENGEPGGLTLATGPNAVSFTQNRNGVSRPFDRFRLDRTFASLAWERDFSEETQLMIQGWGRYNYRLSRRQLGGGFGTLASGASAENNAIQLQEFYNEGVEGRFRRNWGRGESVHTLAAGALFYHTSSPRVDKLGATPDAKDGLVQLRTRRENFYAPFFVENRFKFGNFSITPGVRLENLWQSVEEEENTAKTAAGTRLGERSEYSFVPLFGVGLEYELKTRLSVYGNVSQAYRPKLFTEAVPTEPTSVINADLKEGRSRQYEVGLRSSSRRYFNWDASAFLLRFDDQIGGVTLPSGLTSVENVGRATHKGIEAAAQLDLVGLKDALGQTEATKRSASFSLYGNIMLLDAEFVAGPQKGHAPQHAPRFTFRTGAIYRWQERVKLAMLGTFVGEQFADDNNTAQFHVPGYTVWDATLEGKVQKSVSVLAGINNLLDRNYYSRIRGDGIDPAYRRNHYAGLSFAF
jgi:Fe(3+) dicitrate transport protein